MVVLQLKRVGHIRTGGIVVQPVGCLTCDLTPSWDVDGQVVHSLMPLSPSSIIWYWSI